MYVAEQVQHPANQCRSDASALVFGPDPSIRREGDELGQPQNLLEVCSYFARCRRSPGRLGELSDGAGGGGEPDDPTPGLLPPGGAAPRARVLPTPAVAVRTERKSPLQVSSNSALYCPWSMPVRAAAQLRAAVPARTSPGRSPGTWPLHRPTLLARSRTGLALGRSPPRQSARNEADRRHPFEEGAGPCFKERIHKVQPAPYVIQHAVDVEDRQRALVAHARASR